MSALKTRSGIAWLGDSNIKKNLQKKLNFFKIIF